MRAWKIYSMLFLHYEIGGFGRDFPGPTCPTICSEKYSLDVSPDCQFPFQCWEWDWEENFLRVQCFYCPVAITSGHLLLVYCFASGWHPRKEQLISNPCAQDVDCSSSRWRSKFKTVSTAAVMPIDRSCFNSNPSNSMYFIYLSYTIYTIYIYQKLSVWFIGLKTKTNKNKGL